MIKNTSHKVSLLSVKIFLYVYLTLDAGKISMNIYVSYRSFERFFRNMRRLFVGIFNAHNNHFRALKRVTGKGISDKQPKTLSLIISVKKAKKICEDQRMYCTARTLLIKYNRPSKNIYLVILSLYFSRYHMGSFIWES
jgi:hypothetical protein